MGNGKKVSHHRGTESAKMDSLFQTVGNPARLKWLEVTKVAHYYLPAYAVLGTADRSVNAMTRPMEVREDSPPYGSDKP